MRRTKPCCGFCLRSLFRAKISMTFLNTLDDVLGEVESAEEGNQTS